MSTEEHVDLAAAVLAHVRRRRRMGERATVVVRPGSSAPAPHPKPPPTQGAPAVQPDRGATRVVADSPAETSRPAPGASAPLPAEQAPACADLATLRDAVAGCRACGLCEGRTQTVFADGDGPARVMFIGEAPGFYEDRQGVPFVGKAGQLLTDIVQKGMGLERSRVYIANVLKCRPPENRDPSPEEKRLCTPWLDRQIELVDPEVLIPLGRHAANHVLGQDSPMGRLRGRVHDLGGRKVIPTYHPAYLLRNPAAKKECWADIQLAMAALGLARPGS